MPITEQLNFYCAARALLVNRREDLPVFDQAFEIFWRSIHPPQADRKGSGKGKRARLPGEPDAGPPGDEEGGSVEQAPGQGESEQAMAVRIARWKNTHLRKWWPSIPG